jgi:arsenite-transporting ATPase
VVDTAPTGHTLRLFEMPETLRRFAGVLDDMHEKHRFLASSLGRGYRPDFADATIVDVERDAKEIKAALVDASRTSFTWITVPEELPVLETRDGICAIEALGTRVAVVVANRVWPAPDRPCPLCTPRVADEARWLAALRSDFSDKTLLEVPARLSEPVGVDALHSLALAVRSVGRRRHRETRRKGEGDFPGRTTATASQDRRRHPSRTDLSLPSSPSPCEPSRLAAARLVLFGGKGGVGKTTCAAAYAVETAKRAKGKVLVLSTDPAHSLGDALAMELGDEPVAVAKNLVARELDAKKAFEVERERYRSAIDELFASIFKGRMDAVYDRRVLEDLLDLAPPGIDEIFALVSIVDALVPASGEPAYARVIVDTAPTGHTLRLLALPEKALEWVHAIMSVLLKYRHVIGLGELASDLTALSRRLRALVELVHDPEATAFVAVSRPARLPRLETERLVASLRELRVPLAAIVINAVTEPSCARCAAAAALERRETAILEKLAQAAVLAPAIHPGPRGLADLAAFHGRWSYAARSR